MTAKPKYTPGPWVTNGKYVDGDDGKFVACAIGTRSDPKNLTPPELTEANAHLIAAAPELAESLKALLEQFAAYRSGWLGESVWRERIGLQSDIARAEAALQKAGL